MTTKIVRAYDIDDNTHMFSIVAWDKGFTYVHPTDAIGFDSDKMVKGIMDKLDPNKTDLTIDDYLNIAKLGLSRFSYGTPIEEDKSEGQAIADEQKIVDQAYKDSIDNSYSKLLTESSDDLDQVMFDYPELVDQLGDGTVDITADGMLELVMAALGSIDPNGPNKWLLDYMDGKGLPEGETPQIVFDKTTPKETGK